MERTASIILAGGQGTRLFPLTQYRCKPAVVFGGHYRLIDIPLSHSINANIEQIFVISQYFATFLNEYIRKTYPLDLFHDRKIHLLCPEETPNKKIYFKGTADAVRQNQEHLFASSAEYFLILSGDQLYNMNLIDLFEIAKTTNANLTIAALPVEEKEAKRMGLLKIDRNNKVLDFYEKPSDPLVLERFCFPSLFLKDHLILNPEAKHYLGSMGIYLFKRQALFDLLKEEGDDFGKDLIPKQVKKGGVYAYPYKNYWEDIGTISSYFESNLALTEETKNQLNLYDSTQPIYSYLYCLPSPLIENTLIHRSIISQGAIIQAKEISHSLIGPKVVIKQGTILKDTIVLGSSMSSLKPCSIGKNCHIEKAIIDEDTQIGNDVKLLNKEGRATYEKEGIFIREGIIIVTSGTIIPDRFTL